MSILCILSIYCAFKLNKFVYYVGVFLHLISTPKYNYHEIQNYSRSFKCINTYFLQS